MAVANEAPIIIKKKRVVAGGGHHGGAWKVAYADFVTAMMAFFMLMWLLNATTEEQRDGIADYFSATLPLSDVSAGGASFFNGDTVHATEALLTDGSGGHDVDEQAGDFADPAEEDAPVRAALAAEAARRVIEARAADAQATTVAPTPLDGGRAGPADGEADRITPSDEAGAGFSGAPSSTDAGAGVDDQVGDGTDDAPGDGVDDELGAGVDDEIGSGVDDEAGAGDGSGAGAGVGAGDRLADVAEAFDQVRAESGGGAIFEHVSMRLTPEGLMIEIVDRQGEALFESGSSEPSDLMLTLVEVIAPIVATLENDVAIVGHTDATPFAPGSRRSNWSLSAERADAARRLLMERGLDADRLARIAGAADRYPLSDDPYAPENRRIGITLLRRAPNASDGGAD